jgi:hypothetical protein
MATNTLPFLLIDVMTWFLSETAQRSGFNLNNVNPMLNQDVALGIPLCYGLQNYNI